LFCASLVYYLFLLTMRGVFTTSRAQRLNKIMIGIFLLSLSLALFSSVSAANQYALKCSKEADNKPCTLDSQLVQHATCATFKCDQFLALAGGHWYKCGDARRGEATCDKLEHSNNFFFLELWL